MYSYYKHVKESIYQKTCYMRHLFSFVLKSLASLHLHQSHSVHHACLIICLSSFSIVTIASPFLHMLDTLSCPLPVFSDSSPFCLSFISSDTQHLLNFFTVTSGEISYHDFLIHQRSSSTLSIFVVPVCVRT